MINEIGIRQKWNKLVMGEFNIRSSFEVMAMNIDAKRVLMLNKIRFNSFVLEHINSEQILSHPTN